MSKLECVQSLWRQRHHSSICEKAECKADNHTSGDKKLMTDYDSAESIIPVVVVKVNEITSRAYIDIGAGSSYASAQLINHLNIKPCDIKNQQIDMLLTSHDAKVELYDIVTVAQKCHDKSFFLQLKFFTNYKTFIFYGKPFLSYGKTFLSYGKTFMSYGKTFVSSTFGKLGKKAIGTKTMTTLFYNSLRTG